MRPSKCGKASKTCRPTVGRRHYGWLTTREPQPDDANDRFQDDPHMNLRAPTIAFVEDNRDLRDLEPAGFPDAVSGFYLEQIPDGEDLIQPYTFERATPPALEAASKVRILHTGNQPRVGACRLAKKQ